MSFPPHRPPPSGRGGRDLEPGLRDLLVFLRDTFHEAASRIDRYIGPGAQSHAQPQATRDWRDQPDEDEDAGEPMHAPRGGRPGAPPQQGGRPGPSGGHSGGTRMPLEALRDEARQISSRAGEMDPAEMRLRVEAVTAETRALQNRATDPEDQDIAAKILRALTAIVSEHRPGHVYGLARHHEADWDDVGRRARDELTSRR
ncbi:MAG: hypothetical protein WCJ30_26030 [Deltaproteobacteria bacterium]